jgi:hypothetical protein
MIFRNKKTKYSIKSWPDIMRGQVAFILGNGPSLLENDLGLLDGCFTIGINRIFKVFSPTILFWQDPEINKSYRDEIERLASIKVCRDKCDSSSAFTNFSLEHDPYRFHKTPWRLYGRGCSGGIAIQMAVAMGVRAVVLLGCDCSYISGKTDFYGINKFHNAMTLERFNKAMLFTAKNIPVPVFNCSANEYWPRLPLKEAINLSLPERRSKIEMLAILR